MNVAEIVTAVFGAGSIASIAALIKVMSARKDGFNRARAEHIEDLAKWRAELQDQVEELTRLVQLYQRRSAAFEYQLRANGFTPDYPEEKE
ncbi:hypothetical protein ACN20G_29930 (plasmid) [Streptomyces sp. BI20]|uniref:hypothetical protein n=1 Tax=Streptomyces sp. BI20 TaxID=3403460 RepID=UPI003C793CD7